MRKIKGFGWIFTLVLTSMLLLSCSQDDGAGGKLKTIVAKEESISTSLYFPGTLAPLSTVAVTSPVDGHVSHLQFSYGLRVKKGQELVGIASNRAAEAYQKAISDYLQRKSDYTNNSISFQGEQALYKAGVISRESYFSAKSTYENSVLSFYQSKFALEKILEQMKIDPASILALNLSEMTKVQQLLNQKFTHIVVTSPTDGVALFPVAGEGGGGDKEKTGKLMPGSDLKAGQLMLYVGDLSGLQATINVSEVDVNQIKPGMGASLTGDAFPGITLKGVVVSVSAQANPESGAQGNLAQFTGIINIPSITLEQQAIIRVGMTSKIKITFDQGKKIVLPLSAITTKNNQSFVTIIDKSKGRQVLPVELGTTTANGIIILKGVSPGMRVVLHD
jgi:HlyD family secretion protein